MVLMHRILPLNVTNWQVLLALSFTTYLVINALDAHLFPLLSTMKSNIILQATREIEMPSTMNKPMNTHFINTTINKGTMKHAIF